MLRFYTGVENMPRPFMATIGISGHSNIIDLLYIFISESTDFGSTYLKMHPNLFDLPKLHSPKSIFIDAEKCLRQKIHFTE